MECSHSRFVYNRDIDILDIGDVIGALCLECGAKVTGLMVEDKEINPTHMPNGDGIMIAVESKPTC